MGFYETNWRNEYDFNKPKFYLRYVDDILAAFILAAFIHSFDKEQDSLILKNFLNKKHPKIKFTIENKISHSIAFLIYSFQVSIIKNHTSNISQIDLYRPSLKF